MGSFTLGAESAKQSLEQEGPGRGSSHGTAPGIWAMIQVIKFQEQRRVRGRFSSCPRAAGEWLVHTLPQARPPPDPAGFPVALPGRSRVRGLDAAAATMHELGEKARKGSVLVLGDAKIPGPGAARTWQALVPLHFLHLGGGEGGNQGPGA